MTAGLPFWKGRTVFVTGHTGFKGSWLSFWLLRSGARVTGYALDAPTQPNLFGALGLEKELASVYGDVRDLDALTRSMKSSAPEVVIHMAAQPLVRASYADPVLTYATNVMGTVNVLEAVRRTPSVRSVVVVTTDKCYENRDWVRPYRESDRLGGHDPYSSSKACAELVTASFREALFADRAETTIASVRAGNVIGGGDWARDRLIPDLVRGYNDRTPAVIRRPSAVRPWQHVLEPLSGYLEIAERLVTQGREYAEAWNFGPRLDDVQPVRWVADRFTGYLGEGASWRTDESASKEHEATFLSLDISKATSRLDWQPQWTLDTALDVTARWYSEFADGAASHSARMLCERDLARFEEEMVARS